ncbi:MAG: hypothetical protein M3004_09345, partial [Bacteroidota bacterium]|nr:hypothetical protein [Bacteroidota bacterium]
GKSVAILNIDNKPRAADLISNDGGSIVASGAGNIVASGAGNIVASGAGNLKNLGGFSFGSASSKATASGSVIKTSGSAAIIIQ